MDSKTKRIVFTDPDRFVQRTADVCVEALLEGKKLLFCGNGGSMSDSQHIVGEFVGKYNMNRPPYRALALGSNPAVFSAIANDFGYEHVFAREVEAYADRGDLLFGLSTSGTSKNVVNALLAGKDRGTVNIVLTGRKSFYKYCLTTSVPHIASYGDIVLFVEKPTVAEIQEIHKYVGHRLAGEVERRIERQRNK